MLATQGQRQVDASRNPGGLRDITYNGIASVSVWTRLRQKHSTAKSRDLIGRGHPLGEGLDIVTQRGLPKIKIAAAGNGREDNPEIGDVRSTEGGIYEILRARGMCEVPMINGLAVRYGRRCGSRKVV